MTGLFSLPEMDPLSQATLGAAAASLLSRQPSVRRALFVGACAGMAPDIDVLIRSDLDPMLSLEYHRHFTHALLFAPIIGLLVAVVCKWAVFWKQWQFSELAVYGIVGAFTHGLLDACTSYGTLLYLPFSKHRESWDIISIIDPIFTLPLAVMTCIAFTTRRAVFAKVALCFCAFYLCFGVIQHERALAFARTIVEERGHCDVTQMTARPSFGNTIVWRLVYRTQDTYFVDAVRLMPFSKPRHYAGASVEAFTVEERRALLPESSRLGKDVQRFRFFSQDYLYRYPENPSVLGDLRYAMFPDSVTPLWGIQLDLAATDAHAEFVYFRDASKRSFDRLWALIRGDEWID